MKSLAKYRAGVSLFIAGFFFSLGCAPSRPGGAISIIGASSRVSEEFRAQVSAQASDDPLIGIWVGSQCGVSLVLAVMRNDEGIPYKLKAILLNGSQLGYGFHDGDSVFYVSPLAAPDSYEGKITYRNWLWQLWYPTHVMMSGHNTFTTYDDVTVLTCGGTVHTYWRKDPEPEAVVARTALGSGLLLWNTALVLTANHVVEKASRIRIYFPTAQEYNARVLARDAINDLALLEVRGFSATTRGFRVNPWAGIIVGQTVHALGYPLAPALSRHPSIVSGQISSALGLEDSSTQFRMTAPINPGSSGGPILNQQGVVVGISVSALRHPLVEGITFGIKITTAVPLLQQAGVPLEGGRAEQLTADQIFARYAQDVVLIEGD